MWTSAMRAAVLLTLGVLASVKESAAVGVRSPEERGDDNQPDVHGSVTTDELAYPYFNVHYHFNKHDWNRVLEDQKKLIALRRRLAHMRRRINDDEAQKRTQDFMHRQDGMLVDARATLFQRALYQTTRPPNARGFKKQPPDVHDRLRMIHDDFYVPMPATDFVDINEPYYFQMLAEQRS